MNNDLISRDELLKRIDEEREYLKSRGQFGAEHILVHNFRDLVENAPTVDAIVNTIEVRPQGEWIKDNSGNRFCSECGSSALYHEIGIIIESRFCPNCGADMRGEKSHFDNTSTVAINKDFYKEDKSNPINRSDLFQ